MTSKDFVLQATVTSVVGLNRVCYAYTYHSAVSTRVHSIETWSWSALSLHLPIAHVCSPLCSLLSHVYICRYCPAGVLLLNSVLTVRAHEANSHRERGWEQFTDAAIETLLRRARHPLVFLLWGSYAQKKGARIDKARSRSLFFWLIVDSSICIYSFVSVASMDALVKY